MDRQWRRPSHEDLTLEAGKHEGCIVARFIEPGMSGRIIGKIRSRIQSARRCNNARYECAPPEWGTKSPISLIPHRSGSSSLSSLRSFGPCGCAKQDSRPETKKPTKSQCIEGEPEYW